MTGCEPPAFGRAAEDYARFRAGFPNAFFEGLQDHGWLHREQRVLDLGTGTGSLARGCAARGARVVAVDPDLRMLAAARALPAQGALTFLAGRAERLPLRSRSMDMVAAGQCWHWFDADRAAHECARIVHAGGRVLVAHFDWLPVAGSVVEATERLVLAHNPSWAFAGGDGLHTEARSPLTRAGFEDFETLRFDLDVPYSHEAWRGRMRASAGVGASLAPAGVAAFDRELGELLADRFAAEPLRVPHRIFALTARSARP